MLTIVMGVLVGLLIGAGCRWIEIPVLSPPNLVGVLLVVAMTVGDTVTDRFLARRAATTKHLCGGPTGASIEQERLQIVRREPSCQPRNELAYEWLQVLLAFYSQ
jgi:XapX domain-containing protein